MTLERKIEQAVKFLQVACKDKEVELAYSGGKDSDVILRLARLAQVNYRAIYKNTTIDPPYTLKHCKENGVEIVKPALNFAQVIQKYGLPTRWSRVCCKYLKEYKIGDYIITGIRKCESRARTQRYKEPTQCRTYGKGEEAEIFMPILDWTDEDVEQFIAKEEIKCHPLYYDKQGNFHVERRLGCLCCPLKSQNKRIEEFKLFPRMVLFYARNAKIFMETHPDSKSNKFFRNEWEMLYNHIFLHSLDSFNLKMRPDLWGNRFDCETAIKNYFKL